MSIKKMRKSSKNLGQSEDFGQRLRELRRKAGFSQDYLAKKIGYKTGVSISNIESGDTPPNVCVLAKIAKILNVDLHWLITGKHSPTAITLANQLRPCVGHYISKLNNEIKDIRQEMVELNLKAVLEGQNNKEEVSKLGEKLIKMQSECDTIAEVFLWVFSGQDKLE